MKIRLKQSIVSLLIIFVACLFNPLSVQSAEQTEENGFTPYDMYSVDKDNGDGRHTMKVYGAPINYPDDGKWKPINTTIVKLGDIYGVEAGIYKAYFYDDHVEVVRDSGTVKRYFLGTSHTQHEETTLDISENKATYRNGVDVEYVYTPSGLKQNVILRERPEIDGEYCVAKSKIVFDEDVYASVGGQRMGNVFTAQEGIVFKDKNNEAKSILPLPYSFEYENPDEKVISEYDVTIDGNTVYLNVRCPMSWLSDPERNYPVVIDDTDDTATNNRDNYMCGATSYQNSKFAGYTYMKSGYYPALYGEMRIVMDWTLPSGSGTITEISLNLYKYGEFGSGAFYQEIHELTESFAEANVTWNDRDTDTPWTNAGGTYSATVVDKILRTEDTTGWRTWYLYGDNADNPMDITWGDNFDIIIVPDASADNDYEQFYSKEYATAANRPYILITYGITLGPSTVASSSKYIYRPYMRKNFYANGRYWVFYVSSTSLDYKTSTDGFTWTDATEAGSCFYNSDFSVFFDGTYVHLAFVEWAGDGSILYRRGTPESDGSITWSANEQTALGAGAWKFPTIAVDSGGYPWITYIHDYKCWVTKSSANDGTWSTETNFPYELCDALVYDPNGIVVPLTNQKVLAVYNDQYRDHMYSQLWNGSSWEDEEEATDYEARSGLFSAVNEGDDVHLVYLYPTSPYKIRYVKRTDGSGWGSETDVQTSITYSDTAPVLSIDTVNNNLYCFWLSYPTAHHVYYKKCVSGTWDANPTDWINEETDTLYDRDTINCSYEDDGAAIGLIYMTGSGPDNLRFAGLFPPYSVSSPVGTSTSTVATEAAFQRKTFYANNRHWIFYSDGSNMVFTTSTDGLSWSSATTVRACDKGDEFSIWFDGTYVHYAYSDYDAPNTPIYYRRGTPNSDGSITWSAVEQTAVAGASDVDWKHPFISVDSNGYPWIGYIRDALMPDVKPWVTKASTNDGTWSTATDFPYNLNNTPSDYWRVSVIPLGGGKVYVIYLYTSTSVAKGKLWTGSSWDTEESASTSNPYHGAYHSAVADGNDVHFVFLTASPYNIVYRKRTYGSGWGSETTLQSSTTDGTAPVLSIDTVTYKLYCFWSGTPTDYYIYYKTNVYGTWDSDPTTWIEGQGKQSLESGGDFVGEVYYIHWKSQSFISQKDDEIYQVQIYAKRNGGGTTVDIDVDIYNADGEGKPTGSSLGSATIPSFTSTSYGWRVATFSTPIDVSANQKYCIVASAPDAGDDTSLGYSWYVDSTSPTYADGNWASSDNSGSLWTADTGKDAYFKAVFGSTLYNDHTLTSFYKDNGGYIGLVYMSGISIPYNVGFACLSVLPTVIELASFTAKGDGNKVKVEWETATEIDNLGFNLYRSTEPYGSYIKLNSRLIPGLIYSITGRTYTYEDVGVTRGRLYFYKLEDLDRMGKLTMHGPVCVDWDADGMPDDWEIAQGLNPDENDAGFDYDEDGLSNYWEYKKRTDPFNPDTDGDGIPDGQDLNPTIPGPGVEGSRPQNGFRIIESDSSGMLIELVTPDFTPKAVTVSGTEYQKISIRDYIHGHTETVGSPQVPLKGLFIDLRGNASATLEVEDLETSTYDGYRVYPAPQHIVSDDDPSRISEVFELNQAVYSTNAFYPSVPVEVGKTAYFRDQKKVQLKFYPVEVNPVTGELKVHTLIRVRVVYDQPIAPMAMLSRIFSMASSSWSPNSSSPVYKVQVTEDGIYRLGYSYLSGQGVNVSAITDTRPIKLYHLGSEIPIYISGGDYNFDPGDYIEFYGEALNTKYTSTNVYWLLTDGEHGLRMEERDGSNGSTTVPTEFVTTIHKENDEVYIGTASGSDERDRWFDSANVYRYDEGGYNISADIGLSLPDAADAAHAVPITLALEGYYNGEHLIDVSLNDNYLGQVTWDGLSAYEAEISADQAHLDKVTGQNTLTLSAVSDPDIVYVDWVELEYLREFKVESDRLKFTSVQGAYRFTLQGFTPGSDVKVFDISDTSSVVRLTNFNPETSTLEDSPTQATTYMAMVPIEPAGIVADIASDLSDTANRADYIIITHEDLYDAVLPLAEHRANKGLDVKVVKAEDIYDEFSYGITTPYAIKDFLSYAYTNWTPPAPTFVLLVGDSTYDYKDNLGLEPINYVPTYLLVTEFTGETASDEWFVRISGDDLLSDMYIGRLPAASLAEAEIMINKIISYEEGPESNTWEKHLYFVAGTGLAGGEEATFQAMNEDTSGISLSVYDISKTYGTTQDIDGALMVNYAGHGSATSWYIDGTNQGMDYIISYLNIAGTLPFFVNMTCLNGYFIGIEEATPSVPRSLAESLLIEADQGAIATLSSTGSTVPSGQWLLDYGLFEAIFDKDYRDLGRAISYAKAYLLANSSAQQDVANTFQLFGDPAMELKIPVPKRPTGLTATAGSGGIGLSWEANEESDLAGYNLYRSTTSGTGYEKVNSSLISGASYQDGDISGDVTYYYVTSAVDTASLESGYSSEASCTTGGGEEVTPPEATPPEATPPEATPPPAASSGDGGSSCFICSAAHGLSLGFGR